MSENTENESKTGFYGPASSCEELGMLGYTLNGLYLVDCKDKSIKGKIEVIECRFKQPQGSKEGKQLCLNVILIINHKCSQHSKSLNSL